MDKIHCDNYHYAGNKYIAIVCNFSGMLWSFQLKHETTDNVTKVLLDLFLLTSFPRSIRTDSGGCYRQGFTDWCKGYGIVHLTSSPYIHEKTAESGVKNAKAILKKCPSYTEFQFALFSFRLTPRGDQFSPTDLYFGHSIRDPKLPVHPNAFQLELSKLQQLGSAARRKTLADSKATAGGTDLPPLSIGSKVVLQNPLTKLWNAKGIIKAVRDTGRSYEVMLSNSSTPVIRNRRYLKLQPGGKKSDQHGEKEAVMGVAEPALPRPASPETAPLPILRRSSRLAEKHKLASKNTVRFKI